MSDDPCDSTWAFAYVIRWANLKPGEIAGWARRWLKGTSFEY